MRSCGGSENRQGWFTREPLGIIVAITPYNDPLNLVAHKLGPAIAGGNAVVLKPSELTPLSAIKLVGYLAAAGMPVNVVSVATGGAALVSSRDVRMVSFTGGLVTGERIARSAGLKELAMDLGGNAPVIGNTQDGSLYAPTVLEDVSFECDLWKQEVFGPVVVLRIETLDEALSLANSPEYSLHAGIFTSDLRAALKAADELEAGGVMINDSSDYRFDAMPFGGFKY